MKKKYNVRTMVLFAMFVAIIGILSVTPLGMIPIGVINATTIHIPVIVGAIILGPKFGAALGGVFGLISFLKATMAPNVSSFAFSPLVPVPGLGRGSLWALVIAFVPRILVGIVAYYVYALIKKISKNEMVSMGVGAFMGSVTNTVLVMGLIGLVFGDAYSQAAGKAFSLILRSTVLVNGIPEALVATVISVAVCKAVKAYMKKKGPADA